MNLADNIKKIKTNKIFQLLKSTNNSICLVGGAVRDILSGKNPDEIFDFDIIVNDIPAKEFTKKFCEKNDVTTSITLDEENNIYRIILPDKVSYIDVTNPIENSFEADINRRDITINSIAYDIATEKLIDITGGINDLENQVIKAVREENLADDPLRILRIFRFASTLGFNIDKDTESMINRYKHLVLSPALERRNCEILKLFGGKNADNTIILMDKMGLIDILFPIILDVKKVPPNTHHHLDLFHHSIETVKQLQNIYENSSKEVKEHLESKDFGGETRLAHLKLAGFLHDIGKFSTWTIENDGRHRFIRHDEIGADIAKGILTKQKFSKKQTEYISFIIRHHMYPSSVVGSPNLNDKIYMRYIRKAGDNAIDLITIAKADRLSARGKLVSDEMVKENISKLDILQDFYIQTKPLLKPIPKLLDGNDIMHLLNIPPSKELGDILQALKDAQIDGDLQTKEEAIKFVKEYSKKIL